MVEGTIENPRTVIVEFPSMTAFRAWYDSPEYQEILPLRLKAKLLFSLNQYTRRVSNGRLRSGF